MFVASIDPDIFFSDNLKSKYSFDEYYAVLG